MGMFVWLDSCPGREVALRYANPIDEIRRGAATGTGTATGAGAGAGEGISAVSGAATGAGDATAAGAGTGAAGLAVSSAIAGLLSDNARTSDSGKAFKQLRFGIQMLMRFLVVSGFCQAASD